MYTAEQRATEYSRLMALLETGRCFYICARITLPENIYSLKNTYPELWALKPVWKDGDPATNIRIKDCSQAWWSMHDMLSRYDALVCAYLLACWEQIETKQFTPKLEWSWKSGR